TPAAEGADAELHLGGIAVDHLYILEGDPHAIGHDLGEGRLVPLSMGRGPAVYRHLPRRVDAYRGTLPAPSPGADRAQHLGRSHAADLHIGGHPDAKVFPFLARALLLPAQLLISRHLERFFEGWLIVATVVCHPGRGGVGEGVGRYEVPTPDLCRVH